MMFSKTRTALVRLVSIALISAGFAQTAFAGSIGTGYMIDADARDARIERVEALLAEEQFAEQLEKFGVDAALVSDRLDGLTDAELIMLEGRIDEQTAGGDAIAIIGVVFLVLLILELVGVTDIFKSF